MSVERPRWQGTCPNSHKQLGPQSPGGKAAKSAEDLRAWTWLLLCFQATTQPAAARLWACEAVNRGLWTHSHDTVINVVPVRH